MTLKFVPVGQNPSTFLPTYTHEVIENYIESNWTQSDTPKKDEIRFNYLLEQKIGAPVSFALKCYDGGLDIEGYLSNNSSLKYIRKVRIHIEGKKVMMNRSKDNPIELLYMIDKIINLIMGNPIALRDIGITQMEIVKASEIEEIQKPGFRNYFGVDLFLNCLMLVGRYNVI